MSEPQHVIHEVRTGRTTALWLIVALLAVIATVEVMRWDDTSAAYAQTRTPQLGARGIFAFTGQLSRNSYGLFMLDVDAGTIWCYEYVANTRRLRLVAARSWIFDRYLEEYNCDDPTPAAVAQLVEQYRSNRRKLEELNQRQFDPSLPDLPTGTQPVESP